MNNWYPVGKLGASTTYSDKAMCELMEGQECFDVSIFPSDLAKIIEIDEPIMIEVIKERPLLDELGQPVLDENGQPVIEQYGDSEQAKDDKGELLFRKIKQVVSDEVKVQEKAQKDLLKKQKKLDLAAKLVNLKDKGSKEIKDLIEILGL